MIEPMIEKLFRAKKASSAAPPGERIYAIGDIHGCSGLLDRLMGMIEADSAPLGRRLVFLGDYVDRGPDAAGVIDRLLAHRAAEPSAVFLKGNHEAAMLDFLREPDAHADWLHWGGDKTLESYGLAGIDGRDAGELAADLAAALPLSHREFLDNLELWRTFGDYAFVHAGFRPGVALDEQAEHDCLWIRAEFHNASPAFRPDFVVVHGHQPVKKPVDAGWRIDVDTGAVWSDVLTAVVLEGTTRRFLATGR